MEDFDKFTSNLLKVIERAENAAEVYNSSYIGSEHIVFAMLNTPECTACKVMEACGVQEAPFRAYFARSIDHDYNAKGFTPRTKHMLMQAVELAVEQGGDDALAGTEHMLYAVMSEPTCLAMRIFNAMGVNLTQLASRVEMALHEGHKEEEVYASINTFSRTLQDFNKEHVNKLHVRLGHGMRTGIMTKTKIIEMVEEAAASAKELS